MPYWENRIRPGEPDSHEFGAFWVAAYGTNPRGVPSAIYPGNAHRQWGYPLGNQRPVLWQFGSNALVAGFAVDINAFRGTKAQLKALFYGEPVKSEVKPPSTAPEPVTVYEIYTLHVKKMHVLKKKKKSRKVTHDHI